MFSNNLGRREKATKAANFILREINKGKGVIGGTKKKETKSVIRETDRTLLNRGGLCFPHRSKTVISVEIEEYDLPYQTPPEKIQKLIPEVSYVSGLSIANPIARVLMHGFPIERVNEITLRELLENPKVPVVVDILPEKQNDYYSQRAEDFRVSLDRPHWILRVVNLDYPWITKDKNGKARELSSQRTEKYLSKIFVPEATGVEWVVDYGVIALLPNPANKDKKVVLVGGSHWLSTFTLNAMIYLVERIPEINTEIEGVITSMSWLFDVLYKRSIFFEAIFRVSDRFLEKKRKIDIEPIGLFLI